jgi:flavin-dependent dehydrogenase
VQRAIDSYVWHTDFGNLRVQISAQESRIATVFRGRGPRGAKEYPWESFDGYLLSMAKKKGAHVIPARITDVERRDGRVHIKAQNGGEESYDLLAVAAGVNTPALKLFSRAAEKYKPPQTTKTAIREYYLGADMIQKYMGASLHVFLLDLPKLKFGMIAPKGDFATVCLVGHDIDDALLHDFLTAPEVKACFPPDWNPDRHVCQCMPRLAVESAIQPFADRVVFIGDIGVSRLYKDGIGAAFRAAKAAATTAILHGVSADDFKRHYWSICRRLEKDNQFGRMLFLVTTVIQRVRVFRRAVLRMAEHEQKHNAVPRMGRALWDTFTGSAPYQDILLHALYPSFLLRLFFSFLGRNDATLSIQKGA